MSAVSLSRRPPAWLERACRRLNPCVDLEVDVLAVERAAAAFSGEDWDTGVRIDTVLGRDGAVCLERGTPTALFKTDMDAANATAQYNPCSPPGGGPQELFWYDFWPDPAVVGPNGFVLDSFDVAIGRHSGGVVWGNNSFYDDRTLTTGQLTIWLMVFDEFWNRHQLGDPLVFAPGDVPLDGGIFTVTLAPAKEIHIATGRVRGRTGSGRTSAGAERVSADATLNGDRRVSYVPAPAGFSIGLEVSGIRPHGFFVKMAPNGAADATHKPAFDASAFWRVSPSNRDGGPYDPRVEGGYTPLDTGKNPGDGLLATGAVPNFGARATEAQIGGASCGIWGTSREVRAAQAPHKVEAAGWYQPYHVVRAVTYEPTGTIVRVFDLGATPSASDTEVHFRADDATPAGTSLTYSVRGSDDNATWTSLGAAADGAVYAGAQRYRYYELTATLAASADALTSPRLIAAAFTERRRFSTARYTREIDATAKVDPVTGQTELAEFKLPMLRLGPNDARDLATRLATDYAPTRVEAWVYAKDVRGGQRYFLNSYRLEDREPGEGEEGFTFLSGLDRLKATVPTRKASFVYPADLTSSPITAKSYDTGTKVLTLTLGGTPFSGRNIAGYRVQFHQSTKLGNSYWFVASSPAPTSSSFSIVLEDDDQEPAVGDTVTIHADRDERQDVEYAGQSFAAVFADVRDVQAEVPARLRGPGPSGDVGELGARLTSNRLKASDAGGARSGAGGGRTALDVLQELALHCGGAVVWERGRIAFADIYGDHGAVAAHWDERDYVSLSTPLGANRRMPRVVAKYGYDHSANAFGYEAAFTDADALEGWGRANLYDENTLPDELCKWCSEYGLAKDLVQMLQRAWSTGVRAWPVDVVTPHPWLAIGDRVSLRVREYTDRRLSFDPATLADTGSAVRGPASVRAVIIGKNLWGTKFIVAVRGLQAVTVGVPADGAVGGPLDPVAVPAVSFSAVRTGTPAGWVAYVQASFTPPATPYLKRLEYSVRSRPAGSGTWSPAGTVQGSKVGPDKIDAAFGTEVEVTPITVSVGDVRNVGTPSAPIAIGLNPAPELTITSKVRTAANVTFRFTFDEDFAYARIFVKKTAADPGALVPIESIAGEPFAFFDRGNPVPEVTVPLSGGGVEEWAQIEFVLYDRLSQRNPVTVLDKEQRNAAATLPLPPASAAAGTPTGTTVPITATMQNPLGTPAPAFLVLYRNGVAVQVDALTAGAGGTQVITETGLDPATTYGPYEVGTRTSGGLDSATRAAVSPNPTTAAATIPAPVLSGTHVGATLNLNWTVPPGTPGGVYYEIEKNSGSGYVVVDSPITGTSWGEIWDGSSYRVVVRKSPWTSSTSNPVTP